MILLTMVSIPIALTEWEIIYSYEFDQEFIDEKEWTVSNEVNKCYGSLSEGPF